VSKIPGTGARFAEIAASVTLEMAGGLLRVFGRAAANYLKAGAEIVDAVVDLILKVHAHLAATADGCSQSVTGTIGGISAGRGSADGPLAEFSGGGTLGQFPVGMHTNKRRRFRGAFTYSAVFLVRARRLVPRVVVPRRFRHRNLFHPKLDD
jgi:hypothetical protein